MSKSGENLWPEFNFREIETPLSILQEQAQKLGERTKNVLVGEVNVTEAFDEDSREIVLIYQFFVKAPALSNYRRLLFRLLQRGVSYPVDIYFDPTQDKFNNISQVAFPEILKKIFQDEKTKEIINSLYANSIQFKPNLK